MEKDQRLLLFLAEQSGLHGSLKTSTARLSRLLGMSQQTVSRKLRELRDYELISLKAEPSGCTVSLAKQGIELLRSQFLALQGIFQAPKKPVLFYGTVKNGLGEGRYYISRPSYLKQFKKVLGFRPFFGTLNLAVDQAELAGFLSGLQPFEIMGFETDERSFGKIIAFKVLAGEKQQAAIIFPERTAHPKGEIELIAPCSLRKKFSLKEGNRVSISRP
ncbi:MAG: DUF120 domain-containing protein [archaeon]